MNSMNWNHNAGREAQWEKSQWQAIRDAQWKPAPQGGKDGAVRGDQSHRNQPGGRSGGHAS